MGLFGKKKVVFDSKLKQEFYDKLSNAINDNSFEHMDLDKGIMLNIMGAPKRGESHEDFAKRLRSWQGKVVDKFKSKNPGKDMFGFQYSSDLPRYVHLTTNPFTKWVPKGTIMKMKGVGIVSFIRLKTVFDSLKKLAKQAGFKVASSFDEFLKTLELRLQHLKYKDVKIAIPCIKGLAVICFEIDSMNYFKMIMFSAKRLLKQAKKANCKQG